MGKKGNKQKMSNGDNGDTRRRSSRLLLKQKLNHTLEISQVSTPDIPGEGISPFNFTPKDTTPSVIETKPQVPKDTTPSVIETKPQHAAENVRTVLNSKTVACVNSVMQGGRLPTKEEGLASCSSRPNPVHLLQERNEKRKLIVGETTPNDQSSTLVSSIDNMEEDPATFQRVRYTPTEARNPGNPPQDGSSTPNGHSSPMTEPTDSEQPNSLLEKFAQLRSILQKDRNTLQLLRTQIQHDADAEARSYVSEFVKPEPIVIDLEDDARYIVRRSLDSTLMKIISTHGDIAKDCSFTSLRSRFMEKVCSLYEDLEPSNIFDTDVSRMTSICQQIEELEQVNIDVKCLQDRVAKMVELTEELTNGFALKQEVDNMIKQKRAVLEGYKKELEYYKGRAATLEELIEEEEKELAPDHRMTDVVSLRFESWMKNFKPNLY